ncbi:peptide ABC transporter permease [Scytonema hofmannii PCC 7110]|uniref:Peptide ABC transporter permease n=1 Tax=Scytonema hofmannii PCC 7110 TaxID=128403 RepID=A0A139XEG5_9CYAN|nr:ABC transporter permease [Scytonema hofmannii]KYC43066.1 peptide ABC transporter permease [Scytonema hofmannii PCC 7110]
MSISIPDLLFLTWKSLHSNPVRSGLTTLGVFMGVAAISATLNIADITNAQIEAKLADRDKPYLIPYIIREEGFAVGDDLNKDDEVALKRSIASVRSISSVSSIYGLSSVQYEDNEVKNLRTYGVSQNYISTTGRTILQGRFFKTVDFEQYRPVAVIDQKLAATLFREKSPLNQAIFLANTRLTVIGVVETKSIGQEFGDTSGTLWLPSTFASALAGDFQFSSFHISPYQLEDMPQLKEKVKQVLSKRHPKTVVETFDNTADLLKERELQQSATQALAVVGVIALLISGVGIANITIASVLERIEEIGIRRALGATQFEVMMQFIIEALLLSFVGGTMAIISVHGLTQTATTVIIQTPYQFSLRNAALSMGAAIAVGVGSSVLPALKATKVDIIAALRSD